MRQVIQTRSPSLKPAFSVLVLSAWPFSAAISPANSRPRMCGNSTGMRDVPARWSMSTWLMPTARTRTSASPGFGAGFGASSWTRTSGPPNLWNHATFTSILLCVPRPDGVRDLALQIPAILQVAMELSVGHHHLAAQHGHGGPRADFLAFPRRVIGFVQLLRAHGAALARIQHDDVGIAADGDRAFARIQPEDARRVRRHHVDELLERIAALLHRLGVDHRHARLDAGVAAGGVIDAVAAHLDRQVAAHLAGADAREAAMLQAIPQALRIAFRLERRIGVVDLPIRLPVILLGVEQVLVQRLAVDRVAARAALGDRLHARC